MHGPRAASGIGIRSASTLSTSAFLASSHSTSSIVKAILPESMSDNTDRAVQSALNLRQMDHISSDPGSQKSWDQPICEEEFARLLITAPDNKSRAQLRKLVADIAISNSRTASRRYSTAHRHRLETGQSNLRPTFLLEMRRSGR